MTKESKIRAIIFWSLCPVIVPAMVIYIVLGCGLTAVRTILEYGWKKLKGGAK